MSNPIMTPWGYDILTAEPLPDIIGLAEFGTATGGKYAGDQRIGPSLRAASAMIRNYCGWHIYPSLPCRITTSLYDPKVTRVGPELLIQLPARMVSEVTSVTIGGTTAEHYTLQRNGLLHVYDLPCIPHQRHTEIVVDYIAGLDNQAASDIQDIAASRAIHGLSGTAGVQSESAGGVSVTYNAGWTQGGGAAALSAIDAQTLSVWRLQGVY